MLPYRGKKSRGKFSWGENFVTFEKFATFPRLIFKFVTFPRPIFKIKTTFMCGTAFFPEKSCFLSLGFFKLSAEKCIVGITYP